MTSVRFREKAAAEALTFVAFHQLSAMLGHDVEVVSRKGDRYVWKVSGMAPKRAFQALQGKARRVARAKSDVFARIVLGGERLELTAGSAPEASDAASLRVMVKTDDPRGGIFELVN